MRYEYKSMILRNSTTSKIPGEFGSDTEYEAKLNAIGAEGWKLVHVAPSDHHVFSTLWFMREIKTRKPKP